MLGREGSVFAADRSPLSAAGQLADGFDIVPPVVDPDFVAEVLCICMARQVTHVIPTIDTELAVLAEHRDLFAAEGIHVWVSAPETIHIAQDKRLTNRWLSEQGFPTPRQRDLATALAEANLRYPVIAKPALGFASVGLAIASGPAQLEALDTRLDYVVEEMATGEEYTVDVWVNSKGRCMAAVPRRRLETRAGEVSKGLTVRDSALIDLASQVASALPGSRGVLNVQIFQDRERDTHSIIEINARFGGGFPLSWAAGAHMPVWGVQDLEGEMLGNAFDTWTADLLMLRYDQGIYVPTMGTQS